MHANNTTAVFVAAMCNSHEVLLYPPANKMMAWSGSDAVATELRDMLRVAVDHTPTDVAPIGIRWNECEEADTGSEDAETAG
jgi:hypothetical protein